MTCIAISRDGNTLASGQITHMGYLAEIILWDISSVASGEGAPKLLNRLRLHKVQVQALDFSYNGKYLASIGGEPPCRPAARVIRCAHLMSVWPLSQVRMTTTW